MNDAELAALWAIRRDIHRHPETAFREVRTAAIVLSRLRELPCEIRYGSGAMRTDDIADYPDQAGRAAAASAAIETGTDTALAAELAEAGTAVVAEFAGNRPGPAWAMRFDLDALPIREAAGSDHFPAAQGFAATNGAMHACGHDAHTAIGLALAERLADGDFPGTVRLLFQPGEEGCRGAAAMLAAGAVDDCDRFVGLHLGNSMPAGSIAASATGLLATAKLRAVFTGVPAHAGSAPEQGRNALAAAASATLNLLALPRFSDADTRVNVGTLHAGEATNIVPAHAELGCEVRATDGTVNAELERRARVILTAAAAASEVDVSIQRTALSTSLTPDPALLDRVLAVAIERNGADVVERGRPLRASDDASLLAARVQEAGGQAVFVLVGGGNDAPHHHPRFDIDEAAMPVALDLLDNLVRAGQ